MHRHGLYFYFLCRRKTQTSHVSGSGKDGTREGRVFDSYERSSIYSVDRGRPGAYRHSGNNTGNGGTSGQRRRWFVIKALGGRCAHCGLTDRRVLEVDHVRGDGWAIRRAFCGADYWRVMLWIVQAGDAPGFLQVLCANCHRIKSLADRRRVERRALSEQEITIMRFMARLIYWRTPEGRARARSRG